MENLHESTYKTSLGICKCENVHFFPSYDLNQLSYFLFTYNVLATCTVFSTHVCTELNRNADADVEIESVPY